MKKIKIFTKKILDKNYYVLEHLRNLIRNLPYYDLKVGKFEIKNIVIIRYSNDIGISEFDYYFYFENEKHIRIHKSKIFLDYDMNFNSDEVNNLYKYFNYIFDSHKKIRNNLEEIDLLKGIKLEEKKDYIMKNKIEIDEISEFIFNNNINKWRRKI